MTHEVVMKAGAYKEGELIVPFSDDQALAEIQKIELGVLKDFIKICEEQQLRYFLCEGSLLGGIRHQGFIPWDDDVDIAMPRPDYERFCKLSEKEHILPSHISVMHSEILHVFDNRTKVKCKHILSDHDEFGVLIDIFPIDGFPVEKWKQAIHYDRFLFCQLMIRLTIIQNIEQKERRTKLENIIIGIGHTIHTEKIIHRETWIRRVHKLLQKYDYDRSSVVFLSLTAHRKKEIMPADVWGKGVKAVFEDTTANVPERFDYYLRKVYGDYMTPPKDALKESNHAIELIFDGCTDVHGGGNSSLR